MVWNTCSRLSGGSKVQGGLHKRARRGLLGHCKMYGVSCSAWTTSLIVYESSKALTGTVKPFVASLTETMIGIEMSLIVPFKSCCSSRPRRQLMSSMEHQQVGSVHPMGQSTASHRRFRLSVHDHMAGRLHTGHFVARIVSGHGRPSCSTSRCGRTIVLVCDSVDTSRIPDMAPITLGTMFLLFSVVQVIYFGLTTSWGSTSVKVGSVAMSLVVVQA